MPPPALCETPSANDYFLKIQKTCTPQIKATITVTMETTVLYAVQQAA
jgi:hypothetical protein